MNFNINKLVKNFQFFFYHEEREDLIKKKNKFYLRVLRNLRGNKYIK